MEESMKDDIFHKWLTKSLKGNIKIVERDAKNMVWWDLGKYWETIANQKFLVIKEALLQNRSNLSDLIVY